MAELLQFPVQSPLSFEQADARTETAYTLDLSDADAREAALNIRRSWIVEAPAGSGKTGLLIQRFLKLLAFGDVLRPGEVLAITFTRKAAAELRNRVLAQLTDAAMGKPLPAEAGPYDRTTRRLALDVLARDHALNWHLLQTPSSLNISTIDAFCADLAASRPLLSDGAGRYQPVDDALRLYERAAESALGALGNSDPALHNALQTVLLHRDGQVGDVVQLISRMLGDREEWGTLVPLQEGKLTDELLDALVRPRLEETLERVICGGLTRAADMLGPELLGELARFAHRFSREPGYQGKLSPLALCSVCAHPPACDASQLEHWLALLHLLLTEKGEWRNSFRANHIVLELPKQGQEWLKDLLAEFRALDDRQPGLRDALCAVRCLPPAHYPDEQWHVVKALFQVLRQALVELNILFAERGQCDFTEIALGARALLRSDVDPHERRSAQIAHVLVDEMQDTSAGQYELLESLTRSWDGVTQTVFLVGDPKQSIYLFRQARVARFLRTQVTGLLGDLPLAPLRLTANFRSQAHLVEQFNDLFSKILPAPEQAHTSALDQVEVPFVAAEPIRSAGSRPALHWHTRLVDPDDRAEDSEGLRLQGTDLGASEDAHSIRTLIEDFVARWSKDPPKQQKEPRLPKIAVLARSRAHLAPVIAEFQRDRGRGPLPFRAVDVELLKDRPEILDLLAIVRALLHPGDRIAWLAILRSPVCGLERADLLALCGDAEQADAAATVLHLVHTRADRLSPEGRRRLERTWATLADAHASFGRTAFSTLVERTWRSLGTDAALGPNQRTNAQRFFAMLRKLETGPEPLSVPLLERALRKLYAEPLADAHAVELMTIHKAKGLEWDLVLVPALHRDTGNTHHELLRWLELDGDHGSKAEVILSPISGKGEEASRLSKWLGNVQAVREAAESKRLLYVVCTRAREELHLFTATSFRKDGSLVVPRANTLLRAAWPAAAPILSHLLTQCTSADSGPFLSENESVRYQPHESKMPLALAAAAAPVANAPGGTGPPHVLRLPDSFDPLARFAPSHSPRIPYPPADTLRHGIAFARPEGSFAARAFGNVVHRFLDALRERLAQGELLDNLLGALPGWERRLLTAFRSEGLPPGLCMREAARARIALQTTLQDPIGRWIMAPQTSSESEQSIFVSEGPCKALGRTLRPDRTFLAGAEPLVQGVQTHLWILDIKTAELGGRSMEAFLASEKAKYEPQMQTYARAMLATEPVDHPVVLALFYPFLPHLLYWPYTGQTASDTL